MIKYNIVEIMKVMIKDNIGVYWLNSQGYERKIWWWCWCWCYDKNNIKFYLEILFEIWNNMKMINRENGGNRI